MESMNVDSIATRLDHLRSAIRFKWIPVSSAREFGFIIENSRQFWVIFWNLTVQLVRDCTFRTLGF